MMKSNVRALGATALLLALSPPLASAAPLAAGSFGGHYYEVYAAPGIGWDTAKTQADAMLYPHDAPNPNQATKGHLVTLTSKEEDDYVESLRASSSLGGAPEVWAGGLQTPCATPAPDCGWAWINDDGPIGTVTLPGGVLQVGYVNWHSGEPNDAGGSESHLGLGRYNGPGWNDEDAGVSTLIGGYVVEYDVPVAAANCDPDAGGCELTKGHDVTLPETPPSGSTIGVKTYTFTDDLVNRCGKQPLSLFNGNLVIPAYLCGSPDFLVVVTEPNFGIPSGTVTIENDTGVIFPHNTANDCNSPLSGDPEHQAVVVWQATDSSEMHEKGFPPTSSYLPGIGYAGEFTDGCGSALGSVRGGSYHVIGMHIGFVPNTNALDGYIALTSYKLQLLQVAVTSARDAGAITKAQYNSLSAKSDNAAKLFGRRLYGPTLNQLNQMETEIQRAVILPQPFNHEGDIEMRVLNLIFTIQGKVVPLTQ
jgi:hypothetical protein